MKKSESFSVHEFFVKEGEEPLFEVGIHKYAIKDGDPNIWRNTKVRIECPEFKLEISLPRKVMENFMDLVHDVDMLEKKEIKKR
ncbi:hypothetical protein ES703_111625 [subsurface metagenome]